MSFNFKFHFKSCERPSVLIDHDALRAYNKYKREMARFLSIDDCTKLYFAYSCFVHANDKSTVMSRKRNAIWDDLEAKMTGKEQKMMP